MLKSRLQCVLPCCLPHCCDAPLGVGKNKNTWESLVWCVFQVQCTAQVREGAVEVTVSGLKATDTDIYRCDIEIFYPPPYLRLIGNGSLIHVLGETPTPRSDSHLHIHPLSSQLTDFCFSFSLHPFAFFPHRQLCWAGGWDTYCTAEWWRRGWWEWWDTIISRYSCGRAGDTDHMCPHPYYLLPGQSTIISFLLILWLVKLVISCETLILLVFYDKNWLKLLHLLLLLYLFIYLF